MCVQYSFFLLYCFIFSNTGENCDVDFDECLSNPCQNGANCIQPVVNEYQCVCQPGMDDIRKDDIARNQTNKLLDDGHFVLCITLKFCNLIHLLHVNV